MIPDELLAPYLVSNGGGVALLLVALKWPRAARILFGCAFVAAGLFNVVTALRDPGSYIFFGLYAVGLYREIIYGPFAAHPGAYVMAIAAGQCAAGALLATGRRARLGAAGAMAFLVAIAPFGLGSAFPCTLILAAAAALAVRRRKAEASKAAAAAA